FRPLLQCEKNWDFKPILPWSHCLPVLCWGKEQLTGFDHLPSDGQMAIDTSHDHKSPLPLMKACYPDLSLPELARLWNIVKDHPEWNNNDPQFGNTLVSTYGYRWNHQLELIFKKLIQTPTPFQAWCSHKRVGPQDLAPLRAISEGQLEILSPFLSTLGQSPLSKSTGVLLLEWAVDLILLDMPLETIMPSVENDVQTWVTQLRCLRFPRTTTQENLSERKIRELPWPSRTQAQWLRQGDQTFLEIKLQPRSQKELQQKIDELVELEKRIGQLGVLWKT
ncbi:MAG: hypothetical protein KDD60_10160, partial [Bdellovibrionales bacterium]|nr:hypothetical protein [Bdellovibrionales bacterium]